MIANILRDVAEPCPEADRLGKVGFRGIARTTAAITCHWCHIMRMEFAHLVEILGDEPVFENGQL